MAQRNSKTGPPAKRPEVIDLPLPGVSPDEIDAAEAGRAILSWFGGLAGFFTTAKEMEVSAQSRLAIANSLQIPVTKDEDEKVQRFILQTQEQLKNVEAHWHITTMISRLHRRMTAARSRTTDALESCKSIGNRLHTTYGDNERRRAQAEERRINEERERLAREERDRELRAAEEEAVRREAAAPTLSEREALFVEHLFVGKTPIAAAKLANYKDAEKVGPRMAESEKIRKALVAKQEAATIRRQAEAKKEEPVIYETAEVKPEISRAAGGHDRTTYSLAIDDVDAFRKAAFAGQHGIPLDIFEPNQAVANKFARDWREQVNRWPGCRLVKRTGVV